MKKVLCLLLSLLLAGIVGCTAQNAASMPESNPQSASEPEPDPEPEPVGALNPLTGLYDLEKGKEQNRPVAVMINNIRIAQPVQTGINGADIVYETEVEGGITRLMGVYQDISRVERIGSVRSARYAYIDLAMGHNAIYVHHGQDPTYAAPHLKDTDDYVLSTSNGGARISNGLSSEHTLYAFGDKLWNNLISAGYKLENTKTGSFAHFADEASPVTLPEAASNVTVTFSSSYKTGFAYDAASGLYTRLFNGAPVTDSITGETEGFKNVFVLLTTIRDYADGVHRQVFLESGSGYYFTGGGGCPIHWSKGGAANGLHFTAADGSELTVNAGNSWVCIAHMGGSPVAYQ